VCVCVWPIFLGDSSSDQGAYDTVKGKQYFSVQPSRTTAVVTQKGENTGLFFFFSCFIYAPPSSCDVCLHFIARMVQPSRFLVDR